VVVAALSMMFALATHDFTILYVAENNARETPTLYSIIGLWAALEGSILLWTAILAGATAYVAFRGTAAIPRLATTALVVMFAMLTFFLLLITTPRRTPSCASPSRRRTGTGRTRCSRTIRSWRSTRRSSTWGTCSRQSHSPMR